MSSQAGMPGMGVSPLTNFGLLPGVHFSIVVLSKACAFFLLPSCSLSPDARKQFACRKPRSLLETLPRVHLAWPWFAHKCLSTSASSGHLWNFWGVATERAVTGNRLIYGIIHMPGRLCISSYAAKSLVGVTQRLLATQRPVEARLVEWKNSLCFECRQPACPKSWHPLPTHRQSMSKSF